MKRRAIIIGGSMSGLFSAAFLRQIGWDVDIYERSRVELVGRGVGITGHPELPQSSTKATIIFGALAGDDRET